MVPSFGFSNAEHFLKSSIDSLGNDNFRPKALARLTRKGFAVLCITTFEFTSRALLA